MYQLIAQTIKINNLNRIFGLSNSLLKNGFTPWTKDVCLTCKLQKSLSLKAVRSSLKVLAPKMELKSCALKNTCVLKDKFYSHKGVNCVLTTICSQKEIISVLKEDESH